MAKLVIGLGNPGAEYERTRHNVGFFLVDHLVEREGLAFTSRWKGRAARWLRPDGRALTLLKPQTYMNLSGESLKRALRDLDLDLDNDLIVVHDEIDLPVGDFRFKAGGGFGGHNGLKSIGSALGGREFVRLRIGVGPRPSGDLAEFVLKPFPPKELDAIFCLLPAAAEALETWVREGVATAMNRHNGPPDLKTTEDEN